MKSQETLKACPFCGCDSPVEGKLNPVKLKWRFIACLKCGARTRSSCDNTRVVAAWNRRAESPDLGPVIRKLAAIADPQCGCRPKCRCLEPHALEVFRQYARETAGEAIALLSSPAAVKASEDEDECEFCDKDAKCCAKFDNSYGEMLRPFITVCTACWSKAAGVKASERDRLRDVVVEQLRGVCKKHGSKCGCVRCASLAALDAEAK